MTKQTNFFNQETPFVESEFYHKLKLQDKDKEYISISDHLHENGYCIFDLNLTKNFIDGLNEDISNAIKEGNIKKNPKVYHYNKNPRIVYAWKFSKKTANLANNKILLKLYKNND